MVQANKGTILIVEDDEGVARLQQRRLERAGYAVVSAGTAAEGLQKLTHGIELILLDYRLPGNCTGLDVYAQLKSAGHDLPVIMVTGFSDEATVIRALRAGVRDFVTKSAEYLNYLPEAVERVLKHVRIEHQLAQSQARLSGIIGSARDAILAMDADQRITLFNAAAERIFKRSAEEAAGKPIKDFIPAIVEEIGAVNGSASNGHLCGTWHELRGVRADGSEFPLEASFSSATVEGQQFYIVIVRDVTERRRTQELLRLSEERFRQIAETIGEVFWLSTPDMSEIMYISPAYERVWGRRVETLYAAPSSWPEGIHDEDRARVVKAFQEKLARGDLDEQFRVVRPNGSVRWLRARAFPVRNAAGVVYRIAGIAEDVTALRCAQEELSKTEEQFRQAQKMEAIGRLAGGVAHDFNNLLTIIIGYADMLTGSFRAGDPARELTEEVKRAGERAASLTRQLLAFSRKQVLVPTVVDLHVLVKDMERMLRRLISEDVDLRVQGEAELWPVKVDPGQMEQVVMNLIVNARDAIQGTGKITIEMRNIVLADTCQQTCPDVKPGEYVLLAVRDTGCGMDPATLTRIFEPFFTTKGPEKGTGLGLSTVFGIVKQSGGHISVHSEPGRGSSFEIYLPRESRAPQENTSPRDRPLALRGTETVLIVEDEDGVRALARLILRKNGYNVLEACEGGEALLICERSKGKIDLMVTDVVMPNMSGTELVQRLATIQPEMKVLYLSGYTDDAIMHHGALESGTPFLQKPFSPDELSRKVRELLDARINRS
jgi:two-component system cell cycle sensor histidine kinase/response regulator CckA